MDCSSKGMTLRNAGDFFLCAVIFLLLHFLVRSQEQNTFLLPWHVPGKQSLRVKRLFSHMSKSGGW